MNGPLITIIVPVYNTELCLPKCLDSLLLQTYLNLEILLVDDGSTDNSLTICQEYVTKDDRVKLYHQENLGVCAARNLGLKYARGHYISFIDSDDYVDKKFIETLYLDLVSGDYDFSMVGYDIHNISDSSSSPQSRKVYELTQDNLINGLFNDVSAELSDWIDMLFIALWNKLYKKDLLKGLTFSTAILSEDLEFNNRVFLRVKKAIFNPIKLYFYYQRPDSVSHQLLNKNQVWKVIATYHCLQDLPENQKKMRASCLVKLYKTILLVRYLMRENHNEDDKSFVEKRVKQIARRTLLEMVKSKYIPFCLKISILFFYLLPGSYTLFRFYNER